MKKQNRSLHAAALLAALSALPSIASAATQIWDTNVAAGITTGSGTWNFGSTAAWSDSVSGSNPLRTWSSNADTAQFNITGGNTTTTIDGANGQVGASGLAFTGTGNGNTLTLAGASLQLGAGGLTATHTNQVVSITAPLALSSSQTWSSTSLRTNSNGAAIRVSGDISSLSGTTNLTFDGRGVSNAASTLGGDSRTAFELSGNNTFTGTTTVTGGASLRLNHAVNSGSKLNDNSALILSGGTVALVSSNGIVEVVGSTTVDSGANTIMGNGTGTNSIALGALTHNISGTLEVSNAAAGIAKTTTQNTNGIIGGWATFGGNRFATGSADGTTSTNIAGTAGTTQNTYAGFVATTNTVINTAVSGSGDKTVNTLRLTTTATPTIGSLTLATGSTLTIASGGIIGDGGTSISGVGSNLTSGTSALYVHTPSALTIGSAIVNGAGNSSVALVKAGANTLTLTGTNTYTGATYVNSGTLALNGGSLANGNVFVRGAASFTMNSTSSITFNVNGTGAGQFDVFTQDAGGAYTLGGALSLKFGDTFASGASFDLFDLASGSADGFTSISVSGSYMGALTENSGVWTGVVGGQNFTFTESSGLLQIAASAVPEPSAFAALAGLAGLGMAASRRRRCA